MELLSDLWDRTTDAFTALSENVSEGLVRLFGSSNERQIRQMRTMVATINELEPGFATLSAEDLQAKTDEFRGAVLPGNRWMIYCQKRLRPRASRVAAI